MKAIIQAMTMSGHAVEGARWEADFSVPPAVGHSVQVNSPTDDRELMAYSPKLLAHGVVLDGSKEDGWTITFTCAVKAVKHMIETGKDSVQTMVVIVPENRASEQVMMYLLDRKRCDSAFMKALRGPAKD
jgi:hypothetical protein